MKYLAGFFGGLVTIMMHIIPVAILWGLLTEEVIFGMDIIGNFMTIVTDLGNAGFVGLIAVVFVMYFFTDCKKECAKK